MREYELNYREKIVTWVWERMSIAYPERWERRMGPVWEPKREKERRKRGKEHLWPKLNRPARIWADRLKDIPEEAIGRAVRECTQPGRTELPTEPEFFGRCRTEDGKLPTRREQEKPQPADRELGRTKLDNIKAMLG